MKSKYWLIAGVLGAATLQVSACSSDFHSCYDTRTCPRAGGAGVGEAGAEEAGGPSTGGGSGGASGSEAMAGEGGVGGEGGMSLPDAGAAGDESGPCGGADLSSDPKNCGTCEHDCTASPNLATDVGIECKAGKCVIPDSACVSGKKHCSTDPEEVCEADVTTSAQCGACGVKCDTAQVCSGASCLDNCPAGATKCTAGQSVGCYALATTADHCGSCDKACPAPPSNGSAVCQASACKVQCGTGYHQCNASAQCESDNDVNNCGPTCKQCETSDPNATPQCTNNACTYPCKTGFQFCGFCTSKNDPSNCGACGNVCGSTKTCVNGACTDTIVPSIVSISPVNGATKLSPADRIVVVFSEPMNRASAEAAYTPASGAGVPAFTWDAASTILTIDPKLDYPTSTDPNALALPFKFTIAASAKDAVGNPLVGSKSSEFTLLRRITQILPYKYGGYIFQGDTTNPYPSSRDFVGAGDTTGNIATRGFMTFDIAGLPSQIQTIETATISAQIVQVEGNPFGTFGNLQIHSISFSSISNLAYTAAVRVDLGPLIAAGGPTSVGTAIAKDVLVAVKADYANRIALGNQSQYRIQFASSPSNDNVAQQVWLLTTTGAPLKLTVQYLSP